MISARAQTFPMRAPMVPRLRRWIGVAVLVGASAYVVVIPTAAALVVPLVVVVEMLVVAILLCSDREERRFLSGWTFGSLAVHLATGLISMSTAVRNFIAPDSFLYDNHAFLILQHWTQGSPLPEGLVGKEGFPYMLAGAYRLVGHHVVSGVVINVGLAACLVPLVYDTTRRLFGLEAARKTPWLLVFVPGLVVWPAQLLREAGALFLIALVMNLSSRTIRRGGLAPVFLTALSLALLFTFRAPVAVAVIVGLLPVWAIASSRGALTGVAKAMLGTVMLVGLVIGAGVGYSGYQTTANVDLAQASHSRSVTASDANSGFSHTVDTSTPSAVIRFLPIAVPEFVLGPGPWQIRTRSIPASALGLIDTVIWWALLPALLRGFKSTKGTRLRRASWMLLLPAASVTLVLAPFVGNFGMVLRERTQVVLLLIPLIALGIAVRREARSRSTDRGWVAQPASTSS